MSFKFLAIIVFLSPALAGIIVPALALDRDQKFGDSPSRLVAAIGVPAVVFAQNSMPAATAHPIPFPPSLPTATPTPLSIPTSSVRWKPVLNNDWTPATRITLNGNSYFAESAEKPYSLQISTNTTTPIIRAEVRNNELWTGAMGGNDTERAELDGAPVAYPKGTEFWLSYQFLVEPGAAQIATAGGFPGGPLAWGTLGQVHSSGSQAAVPWALSFVGETLSVRTQRGNQVETVHWRMPGKLVRGAVHSVVVRIKITGDTDSTMTCWLNGIQVANSIGLAIGGSDPGNYPKIGIYRGWQGDGYPPLAMQIANVEQGTASLLARVKSPLPWPSVR